jgi:hypothetical protein
MTAHCTGCAGTKIDGPWGKKGRIATLPATRPEYKGKNAAGGRKAIFAQSSAYKSFAPTATEWHGWHAKLVDIRSGRIRSG